MRWHALVHLVFLSCFLSSMAQESDSPIDYLEDQFYLGVSYNSFNNKPDEFSQNKFPYNINVGFIRDIPLNTNRNFGIGVGLGYAFNNYFGNTKIVKTSDNFELTTLTNEDNYSKNHWITHSIELPFQIRWRTSTIESYKFWRIYTGIKASYLFSTRATFRSASEKSTLRSLPLEKLQWGLTTHIGHSTWNLSLYYGISSFFEKKSIPNHPFFHKTNELKLGLIFYIF